VGSTRFLSRLRADLYHLTGSLASLTAARVSFILEDFLSKVKAVHRKYGLSESFVLYVSSNKPRKSGYSAGQGNGKGSEVRMVTGGSKDTDSPPKIGENTA